MSVPTGLTSCWISSYVWYTPLPAVWQSFADTPLKAPTDTLEHPATASGAFVPGATKPSDDSQSDLAASVQ